MLGVANDLVTANPFDVSYEPDAAAVVLHLGAIKAVCTRHFDRRDVRLPG